MDRRRGMLSSALGGGVLLGLTVLGLVEGVLSAYAPPTEPNALLETAVGVTLLAWAISLLPRRRWLAWIGALLVWGWLLWRRWAWVCYGALVMLRQVTEVLSGTFPVSVLRPAETVSPWAETQAVTWWLGMALAVWALLLGEITVRRRCWWATALLTLPPLLPALLSGVTPARTAMVALPAVWIALLLQSAVRRTAASDRQLWLVLPAALAAVAAVTTLLPAERYVQPAWTADARGTVLGLTQDLWETVSGEEPGEEQVDLSAAGPLRYTGRVMLRLESAAAGHYLLRGRAFGVYTGESWSNDDGADYPAQAENVLFLPAARAMEQDQPLTPSPAGAGALSSMVITPEGENSAWAFCPYQPAGPVQGSLWAERDLGILSEGESYLVQFIAAEPAALRLAGQDGPSWETAYGEYVRAHYLDVPEELEDLLWEVLQPGLDGELTPDLLQDIPAEYATALGSADVVAQCLARWAEYDPDTPRTPAGEDFVAHFLAQRRGYCMHFASAGVLMLRLLGIPARYVTGYSADIPDSGEALVPDSAAHAWAEIYLEGYGWYPVEMTPGYGGGEEPQPPEEPEAPGVSETPQPEEPETPAPPEETDTPAADPGQAELSEPSGEESTAWGMGWIWPAALVLFLSLWRWGLAVLRRRRLAGPDTNRAVIAAYRSMERMTRWGGGTDPRLTELAGKARFSQYTLTEAERQEALERLESTAKTLEGTMPRGKRLAFRWLWGRR